METVAWIGFSQALFAGLLIATKKGRSISDKVLASWLFLIAIEFGTYAIDLITFKGAVTLSNPFLLFNPTLYLYTCSLTDKKFSLRWIQLLHLLPYIFLKLTAYLLKEKLVIELFLNKDSTLWFRILFIIAMFVSWTVYSVISIIKVHKHRLNLENEFSTLDSYKRISWLLFVLVFYMLYWTATVVIGILNYFIITEQIILTFSYSVLLGFIYILGFYGLKQELIFREIYGKEAESNGKYKYSRLQNKYKLEIQRKIRKYFNEEKPYLDSDLTIGKLSDTLNLPRHVVTEVLNTGFNKNFYQFVNEYRVSAVKKMLTDPKKDIFSIEAIGYECGFNSKSTFFSVFKSITGKTPAQFKQS
jgi:AraC-like DNA-binding protein